MAARRVGRITSRAAFAELRRSPARGASGPVRAAFVAAPEGAGRVFPQFGYAIGRGCGSAVTRNRLRRRARAVVHAEAETLPAGAFLLRFDPGAGTEAPARLRADVARALRRAAEAGARVS